MRFIYKLSDWYRKYQKICWILSLTGGVATPWAGYGLYAIQYLRTNRLMAADDPELVSERILPNPIQFFTSDIAGITGLLMKWLLVIGLVLVCLLLMLQIFKTVAAMSKNKNEDIDNTGSDESEDTEIEVPDDDEELEPDEDEYDDYGPTND